MRMRLAVPPLVMLVVVYGAAVQYTWLNYSINARNWIPYRIYPFT